MTTQLQPPIYNSVPNGLKASYSIDFSVDTIYNLYLNSTYQGDAVTPVSLYIDNLNSDQDITVTLGGMSQKVPAYSSGSLQVNGASSVELQCSSSSTAQAAFDVLNYPISYGTSAPGRGISPSLNNYPVNAPTYSVLGSSKGAGYVGTQRPEANSVLRNAQTRLDEIILSPADFGMKGDGQTNDTPAIQNAVAALPNGGVITLPANTTIYLGTPIQLASNITLRGRGPSTVLLFGDGVDAITATGTGTAPLTDISVRNLRIKKSGGTTGQFIKYTFCDYSDVSDVVFDGNLGANPCYMMFLGTRWNELNHCKFKNGASAIWSSSDQTATGTWGEANGMTSCRMVGAIQGFDALYQYDLTWNKSIAKDSTGTYGCGFVIEGQNQGVIVNACIAYNHVRDGFYVEGNVADGCKDIQFIGCIAHDNGEAGIKLDANYHDVNVTGGAYFNNKTTFAAGTGHGIFASGSSHVMISNAAIHNNAGDGINYYGAYIVRIANCDIHDNTGWGVNFQGNAPATVTIAETPLTTNTAGTVNNWSYAGGNEWDDGPYEAYTPKFYKSDNATLIGMGSLNAVYKSYDGFVEIQGIAETPTPAPDGFTYITLPIAGPWPADASLPALRPRGYAAMDSSGMQPIDGAYSNNNLRITKTASTDTVFRFNIKYEKQ